MLQEASLGHCLPQGSTQCFTKWPFCSLHVATITMRLFLYWQVLIIHLELTKADASHLIGASVKGLWPCQVEKQSHI